MQELSSRPCIEGFKPDRSRRNADMAYEVLIKDQSVFDAKSVLQNPLPARLKEMKINYDRDGGFYHVLRVKLSEQSNQYIDYSILIGAIQDKSVATQLRRQSSGQLPQEPILFSQISSSLTGIGRLV